MSHGDSFDTFTGTALTRGDGSARYRALRIDRVELAERQPGATGQATGDGSPLTLGPGELGLPAVLSHPDAVELQVFVVEIEDDATYVALCDRDKIVTYPVECIALEVTDWGAPRGGTPVAELLDEVAYEGDGLHEPGGGDSQRRTAGDRDQVGKHAHQPARRQRVGGGRAGGGWVG